MPAIRTLGITLLLVLLTACGFRLQGVAELPPETASVRIDTADPYSPFIRRLSILLEQSGARVSDDGPTTSVLEVPVNQVRKDVLSIGDTARVREFRLVHQVQFRLVDSDGAVLVPTRSLEQSRVISFDEQDILAATREEEFLRKELADTLSRQVLRELSTAGS